MWNVLIDDGQVTNDIKYIEKILNDKIREISNDVSEVPAILPVRLELGNEQLYIYASLMHKEDALEFSVDLDFDCYYNIEDVAMMVLYRIDKEAYRIVKYAKLKSLHNVKFMNLNLDSMKITTLSKLMPVVSLLNNTYGVEVKDVGVSSNGFIIIIKPEYNDFGIDIVKKDFVEVVNLFKFEHNMNLHIVEEG